MANDIVATNADMTGDKAIDVLDRMAGQLAGVMDHFDSQQDISQDTKQKTLSMMNEQLDALRIGAAALRALKAQGEAGIQTPPAIEETVQ